MNQELYNLFSLLTIATLAVAVFMLGYEYRQFRQDVTRILGALGIVVVNNRRGMTVKVEERRSDEGIY